MSNPRYVFVNGASPGYTFAEITSAIRDLDARLQKLEPEPPKQSKGERLYNLFRSHNPSPGTWDILGPVTKAAWEKLGEKYDFDR
jgi:hypothetical protein